MTTICMHYQRQTIQHIPLSLSREYEATLKVINKNITELGTFCDFTAHTVCSQEEKDCTLSNCEHCANVSDEEVPSE